MSKKRFFSVLLTLLLIVTLLPSVALASNREKDLNDDSVWITDRVEPNNFKVENGKITFTVKEQAAQNGFYAWQGRKAFTEAAVSSYWKVSYTIDVTETMLSKDNINASVWVQVDKAGTNGAESQKDCVDWSILQFINTDTIKWQAWNANGKGSWKDINNVDTTMGEYRIDIEFFNGTIKQYLNGQEVNTYDIAVKETAPAAVIAQGRSYGESFAVSMGVPSVETSFDTWEVQNDAELAAALKAARSGATIVLGQGTYTAPISINESITLKGTAKSVVKSRITVTGTQKNVVIDGLRFTEGGHIMSTSNNAGTNLTIRNCNADALSNTFVYTSGDPNARMGKITVENNLVTNITGTNLSAFNLWNASEHEIKGNDVENINFHAFNLDSTIGNVWFEGNTIKNTGKGGLQIANYAIGEAVIIKNNTFENVANRPYYNDDEAQGLNYAAIRIYSSGKNTEKGIQSDIDITYNTFTKNPISVWVSSKNTLEEEPVLFPVDVELHFNKFDFDENSHYGVYAVTKNPVEASDNYWDSEKPALSDINFGEINVDSLFIDEDLEHRRVIDEDGNIRVDTSVLQALIDAYKDLKASDYTKDSWAAYEKALAEAKAVLADVDATEAEVEIAKNNLEAAYHALKKIGEDPNQPGDPENPGDTGNAEDSSDTGTQNSPQTGDTSNLLVWFILMLVGAGLFKVAAHTSKSDCK